MILLGLFCLPVSRAIAGDGRLKAGLALPFEAKFNVLSRGSHFRPFQSVGLDAVLQVNEREEGALFFQLKAGFRDDFSSYPLGNHFGFHLSRYIIDINPQVMMSLRQGVTYVLGIGIDWALAYGLSFSSSQGSGNGDLDQIDAIAGNNRDAIPFVNTGLQVNITPHVFCDVHIKQTFLNYFGNDHSASFDINNHQKTINLSYQPTYLGIEVGYFF